MLMNIPSESTRLLWRVAGVPTTMRSESMATKHRLSTLLLFSLLVSVVGCYNTFTRDDLDRVRDEPTVMWTGTGPHYHLQQWTIDENGNVTGTGTTCISKSVDFHHAIQDSLPFSGAIPKIDITKVKTSSTHSILSSNVTLVLVIAGAIVAVALAIAGMESLKSI